MDRVVAAAIRAYPTCPSDRNTAELATAIRAFRADLAALAHTRADRMDRVVPMDRVARAGRVADVAEDGDHPTLNTECNPCDRRILSEPTRHCPAKTNSMQLVM